MLSIRYNGGHQIEKSTIKYVEKINARFKVYSGQQKIRTEKFDIVSRDVSVTKMLDQGNNKEITVDEINILQKYLNQNIQKVFS